MMMEEDLDLGRRVTKRELLAMSEDEVERYFDKTLSAHKHWWQAEQRLCSNGSGDTE